LSPIFELTLLQRRNKRKYLF